MKRALLTMAIGLALLGAGCYDDDQDYSYATENCTSVEDDGIDYQLCCRLRCVGEYDYDDFEERCDEELSCESVAEESCPPGVIARFGYPHCIY